MSEFQPDIQRLLPQAVDAERAALSSLLLAPRDIAAMCEEQQITANHFHLPAHQIIFRFAMRQITDNGTTDIVTLTEVLRDHRQLDAAGGAALITDIFTFMPTAANAAYYLRILEEKRVLREMIRMTMDFASRCYDDQGNAPGMLDEFERAAMAIRKNDDGELREEEPKEAIMQVIQKIEDLYERRGVISGLSTGYAEIDEMLDGLHPEEMVVIAARPSMGKTALGMNIAEHVAIDGGKTVIVFTLEMSTHQLYQRVLLSRARVNMHGVRKGFLTAGDFPKLTVTAGHIAGNKLRIVDAIGASISAVRAKARRMARKYPDLACIVVDYLQKMRSSSPQAINQREREIADISGGLKDMAKELRVPVVVLAQLNREADKRTGGQRGVPRMSDLRESGAIEQDADVIGLLYREEKYAEDEEEKARTEGKATLIIAKNRNGPVGDIPLTFIKEFARYENRARDVEPEKQPQSHPNHA